MGAGDFLRPHARRPLRLLAAPASALEPNSYAARTLPTAARTFRTTVAPGEGGYGPRRPPPAPLVLCRCLDRRIYALNYCGARDCGRSRYSGVRRDDPL